MEKIDDVKRFINNKKRNFVNVEIVGDYIYERYIDYNGEEKFDKVKYQPTLFMKTQDKTKYKDIYGNYAVPFKFDSISEAREWIRSMKNNGEEYLGMDDFVLAYISDTYKDIISYDMRDIRVAFFDIEVTTNGEFPHPHLAKYPIDAISLYDSIDDKIYIYDLIVDVESGLPRVKPWKLDYNEIDPKVAEKVVYMEYTDGDELLLDFLKYIREKQPALLSGWNSEGFDIPYIVNRLGKRFGEKVKKTLSPYNEIFEKKVYDKFTGEEKPEERHYIMKGLAHLDYLEVYKAFKFKTQPSYRLDDVAKYETGEGKVDYLGAIHTLRAGNYLPSYEPPVFDKEGNIITDDKLTKWLWIKYKFNQMYEEKKFVKGKYDNIKKLLELDDTNENKERTDIILKAVKKIYDNAVYLDRIDDEETLKDIELLRNVAYDRYSEESHRRFINYSIIDTNLLPQMDIGLAFIKLVFDVAYLAKMPVDKVLSKIKIWDAILFNSLKERNIVVPMMEVEDVVEKIEGAFVKDPKPGAYNFVVSFDLTSLN